MFDRTFLSISKPISKIISQIISQITSKLILKGISYHLGYGLLFLVVSMGVITGCGGQNPEANKAEEPNVKKESSLVFQEVTLEKFDDNGQPLWKVNAQKVVYGQDKKIANVTKPKGNLFQDGKVVLQVEAEQGQIFDDGKQILLNGKIIAIDPRNQAVLKGDKLQWKPEESMLIMQENLTGNNSQLQFSARIGRYFTKEQKLELQGQVVAVVKEPPLRMQSRYIQWLIPQEKINSDRILQISHYQKQDGSPNSQTNLQLTPDPNSKNPPPKLLQKVESEQVEYDLKTKVAILKKNVQLNSIEPPAQAVSNNITWNIIEETVLSPETIKIVQVKDQLTVTGNQGLLNLKTKIADLVGGVQAISDRNQSTVFANQMQWNLETQALQATGNVIYQQVNPALKVVGSEAAGKLNTENIVVTGTKNPGGQVITEIIPKE